MEDPQQSSTDAVTGPARDAGTVSPPPESTATACEPFVVSPPGTAAPIADAPVAASDALKPAHVDDIEPGEAKPQTTNEVAVEVRGSRGASDSASPPHAENAASASGATPDHTDDSNPTGGRRVTVPAESSSTGEHTAGPAVSFEASVAFTPTPEPPPKTPVSEEEALRQRIADAEAQLEAVQDASMPSPEHRRKNAQIAMIRELAAAETRHLRATPVGVPSRSLEHSRTLDAIASTLSPLARLRVDPPASRKSLSASHLLGQSDEAAGSPSRAGKRLPPLNTNATTAASSPSHSAASTLRVSNAMLAMSTSVRQQVVEDERQALELQLAHALEEHAAIAHRHAISSAEFASHANQRHALMEEESEYRASSHALRAELRVTQAELLEIERRSLAMHAKLRDMVLKLQRSRLKSTELEGNLTQQLRALTKELRGIQRVAADEEANFQTAMQSTNARATELERQLKFFDADRFVEEVELGELTTELQHQSLGVQEQLVQKRKFKPFAYTAPPGGAAWASNAAPHVASPSAAPVSGKPPTPTAAPATAHSETPAPSVSLLTTERNKNGSVAALRHPATTSTDDAEAKAVLEAIEAGGLVPGPMPPTARLESALKAYKLAAGHGTAQDQTRLRKFLAGEF